MLRNLGLWLTQGVDQFADTNLPISQQMQERQSGLIAEGQEKPFHVVAFLFHHFLIICILTHMKKEIIFVLSNT